VRRAPPGPTVQGLIVAAGLGSRLRPIAPSKPLARVGDKPLIQSVIESAAQGGVGRFVVVTGYEAKGLEGFLAGLARATGLVIETVRNPDWLKPNGLSVVAARPLLEKRFVLMMADHLLEPAIIADLLAAPARRGVTLAVDRRLNNPLVDLDDVTRVETDAAGRILKIGKGIAPYDAFDTGVFLAGPMLLDAVEEDLADGGTGSISGGMTRLADRGLAHTFDIGARFWLDIDDPVAHGHAEQRLRA
jgi:choline kinase